MWWNQKKEKTMAKRPPLSDEPEDKMPAPEEDVVIVSKKAKAADPAVAPVPAPVAPPPPPAPEPVVMAPPPAAPAYTPPPPVYTPPPAASGPAPSFDYPVNNEPPRPEEPWMKSMWRPAMGWLYMIICFMDFVGFPLLTIFLPIIFKPFGLTMPYTAWSSITLSNGGLVHLAFGAILGVSAFSRGQEKKIGTP